MLSMIVCGWCNTPMVIRRLTFHTIIFSVWMSKLHLLNFSLIAMFVAIGEFYELYGL